MKTLRLFSLLIALAFFSDATAQQKRALVVAIGNYPSATRWKRLNSLKDLQYVKQALLLNGFKRKDIDTLVNQYATKKAMVNALNGLCKKAQAGDIIYFHFSGHGQQIQDNNEEEVDGYDEALIPYDAKGYWDDRDYHGENHFRDDLLEEMLNKIRAKVGAKGSVLVVIDACHSGTITRGGGIVRGIDKPCQSASYSNELKLKLGSDRKAEQGMLENIGGSKSKLIAISACSPNQMNREMNDANGLSVGSLSYAFAKAITALPVGSSYSLLFEKIKAIIQNEHPDQIPMIEGNEGMEVFGGNYVPMQETIVLQRGIGNDDYKTDDTTFYINRGLLYNLNTGTALSIYQLGEKDAVAKAVIIEANSFKSICVADRPLKKGIAYEVKIDKINYSSFSASFMIVNKTNNPSKLPIIEKQLTKKLASIPYLSKSSNADFTIAIETVDNNTLVSLVEPGDYIHFRKAILKNDTLAQQDLDEMLDYIKQGIRVKYLRRIEDGGELSKNVKIEILRKDSLVQHQHEFIFKPKDSFTLKITNIGLSDFYYTILDLLPNNQVKVLLPDDSHQPSDNYLAVGKVLIATIIVDPETPNGKEVFKLIASPEPLELKSAFSQMKTRSGIAKPFEKVMDDLFKSAKNTKVRSVINMNDIGIVSTGFTVRK
jgi:hypothetical protein